MIDVRKLEETSNKAIKKPPKAKPNKSFPIRSCSVPKEVADIRHPSISIMHETIITFLRPK